MNKEKQQIEEMAKVMCGGCADEKECMQCLCADWYRAEKLYNANFRKQEWISVDERLPEENGRYLACVNVSHLAFTSLTVIAIMDYGKEHGFYLYSEAEPVTHWMPLPEAPKMKGGAE